MDRLTPTERKPARALLANYPVAGLETVARFAARSGVSGPTILRLVAKLGYPGYARFQSDLRSELQERLQTPITKHSDATGDAGEDFLERFARVVRYNVELSIADLPRAEFEGALELLADPRRQVFVLGGRLTDPLARYLFLHLHALRPGVQHIGDQVSIWPEYLADMDRRAVLVVFDIRRYQDDVIRFARQASERGAAVVLFTDRWLSPVSAVARRILPVRIDVGSSWDSSVATMVLVEALVTGLSERHWPQLRQRIETLEQLRRDGPAGDKGDGDD